MYEVAGWGVQRGAQYVVDFPARPAKAGNDPLPGSETGHAAAVERTNYPVTGPGRKRALRCLLLVRRGLPCGLHLAAGHAGC